MIEYSFFKPAIILAFDFTGQKMCCDLSTFTSKDSENALIYFDERLCHRLKPCKLTAVGHATFFTISLIL